MAMQEVSSFYCHKQKILSIYQMKMGGEESERETLKKSNQPIHICRLIEAIAFYCENLPSILKKEILV